MKRVFIFLILLLPFITHAQQGRHVYTIDSFKNPGIYFLDTGWRFTAGDNAAMALPGYDDSKWKTTHVNVVTNDNKEAVSNIGWFRYHFITDSTLNNFPLALEITHLGASEIYCDGIKIGSFGVINGRDSSIYMDPQNIPFLLIIPKAGPHVIAVRYANYDAQKNYKRSNKNFRGFSMRLGSAKYLIASDRDQTMLTSLIYLLLFGIFIALAMSHLFLYLFYRLLKSNLYFSIFCFALGLGFFEVFLDRLADNPKVQLVNTYITIAVILTACYSLSGFTNELFSGKKLWLRIINIWCIICLVLWFTYPQIASFAILLLIGAVLFRTILLTVKAMYKKVKGARIIGVGILFFAVFLFSILLISFHGIHVDENTVTGQVFLYIAACAILSIPVSLSLYLAWSFAGINKDLNNKLQQVKLLSDQTQEQAQEKKRLLESQNEMLEKEVALRTSEIVAQKDRIEQQHSELKIEKKKTDDLLLNILPEEVAAELKEKGYSDARLFNDVTVLFTDFVDFTKAGETMSARELVNELHICFKNFDEIISKYNIEKIKTIGDAYLAVCGLPLAHPGHAANVVNAAMEIVQFMKERKLQLNDKAFEIRVGIHSGSVVAGIVGVKKFAYDIWGDTVNTAARMEQNSIAGRINISQTTFDLIKNKFECTYRGEISAKNKGELSMYFVDGPKK